MIGRISDDDLERYLLNTVTQQDESAPLKEPLLVCGQCIDRTASTEAYITAIRTPLGDG